MGLYATREWPPIPFPKIRDLDSDGQAVIVIYSIHPYNILRHPTAAAMEPAEWQHGPFLISTRQELLQPEAVNDAFSQPWMYWAKREKEEDVGVMLRNSLCFGVYEVVEQHDVELDILAIPSNTRPPLRQIGLGRIVTDYSTLAYLTDMYLLPSHQGRGLARKVLQCMSEVFERWPLCRRLLFITNEHGKGFYESVLDGLKPFEQGKNGYMVMSKTYQGALGNLRAE